MDWEVLFPALAFTITGAFGIWASFDTNFLFPAETFIQGLHATSMFVLALGLMLLPGGLFKGGTPRPRGAGLAVVVTLLTMTAALGILFVILNF
ncbi:MAG: hypothetical protein MK227_00395 [Nitrososphaerales archaeon]|nr:hypothetical protein [Nitrososphaerales archaeon]|tara:strand:+ start:4270 stop:4551 length:282 start_codon:yes stop_codon:yes gene_type:complete